MKRFQAGRRFSRSLLGLLAIAAGWAGVAAARPQATPKPQAEAKPPAAPKYIGASKCKNCHNSAKSGDQFNRWKDEKHSKAFQTLATPEAKKLGQEKGIDDPQKSEQCTKCHTTGAGEPAERFAKGFERRDGVQCETCHGPGERHLKARMASAATAAGGDGEGQALQEIPKDEIDARPALATCLKCHNEESPSFKPFCFKKRLADLAHLDPRRKRTKEELDAMKCGCGENCKCTKGECGDLTGKR